MTRKSLRYSTTWVKYHRIRKWFVFVSVFTHFFRPIAATLSNSSTLTLRRASLSSDLSSKPPPLRSSSSPPSFSGVLKLISPLDKCKAVKMELPPVEFSVSFRSRTWSPQFFRFDAGSQSVMIFVWRRALPRRDSDFKVPLLKIQAKHGSTRVNSSRNAWFIHE